MKMNYCKKLVIIVSIMLAIVLLSGCGLRNELYSKAQSQMLSQLKAPSTAVFSPDFEVEKFMLFTLTPDNVCGREVPMDGAMPAIYKGENYVPYYEVSFWVDAENSYGAMLRTDYTCQIDSSDKVECDTTEYYDIVKELCS